eukprot:GDKI01007884.1.p1 GENE.GDKI01007884.1~~GDKI01007884.1.p1  ORF type:complete len:163 (+),score=51.43 GDKI01007884.1:50-490(+)
MAYWAFRLTHHLMPLAAILATVHTMAQKNANLGIYAEGVVLLLATLLCFLDAIVDHTLTHFLGAHIDTEHEPRVVDGHIHLRFTKKDLKGPLAGRFISLTLPKTTGSYVSHPFTMVPAPGPTTTATHNTSEAARGDKGRNTRCADE